MGRSDANQVSGLWGQRASIAKIILGRRLRRFDDFSTRFNPLMPNHALKPLRNRLNCFRWVVMGIGEHERGEQLHEVCMFSRFCVDEMRRKSLPKLFRCKSRTLNERFRAWKTNDVCRKDSIEAVLHSRFL